MRREDAIDLELLRTRERASNPFIKVSAFGTVIRTLGFVESPACLGRRVPWAFDGDQLLVVPVAGEMDNAYYDRDAHSLLFYFFAPEGEQRRVVYSALSQDIVAHEATHAIVSPRQLGPSPGSVNDDHPPTPGRFRLGPHRAAPPRRHPAPA